MSSMRVLVVDDEQLAREELCYQLDQLGDIEIVVGLVGLFDKCFVHGANHSKMPVEKQDRLHTR